MCIHNYTIENNSKLLYVSNHFKTRNNYPCGICYQCLTAKSKEYILRGYYEAKRTFENNGYVLFDTLTYSEDFVPHINEMLSLNLEDNFYCFRHSDIVNFFKRLRINLQRQYNEKSTLCYLYSGEYGTSENCTHRPHTHIIFFYRGKLNPIELSYLISDNWKYGRTDGVKYKGDKYVIHKRVFSNIEPYSLNMIKYVTKYVEKETSYKSMINYHINTLIKNSMPLKEEYNYKDKQQIIKLRNLVRQYQRVSNNFGANGINYIDTNNLINNNNMMKIPDTKKGVQYIPLPTYYRRKKYQNLVYYNIGRLIYSKWVYNDEGKNYYMKLQNVIYNNTLNKIHNALINCNLNVNNEIELAKYVTFKQYRAFYNDFTIDEVKKNYFNDTSKQIVSFNTRKDKYLLGDKWQSDNYNVYVDEEYEMILNSLNNYNLENNKLRDREYKRNKELENRYKYLCLK